MKINILIAYPYINQKLIEKLIEHKDKFNLLIDSGAFTAWNTGKIITLDGYCKMLDSLPIEPERYFALDVIGDAKATEDNYDEMLKRGYKPSPVFTRSQNLSEVDKYFETADMIGCGGLVNKEGPKPQGFIDKVMKQAKGRKVHLLGYTQPKFIKYFRPYSCDSSSWIRAMRYGIADVYMGQGNYVNWSRRQAKEKPSPKILAALKNLGFELDHFKHEKNWSKGTNLAQEVSTRTWLIYQHDIKKHINVKLFLALGDWQSVERLATQYNWLQEQTV